MNSSKGVLFFVAIAILLFGNLAQADTIYTYTGLPMTCTSMSNACPSPTLTLNGTMRLAAPLAPNMFFGTVNPTSYDFVVTGGPFTSQHFTEAPPLPDQFRFITDPMGAITGWQISFTGSLESAASVKFVTSGDSFNDSTGPAFSSSNATPGSWTVGAPVPEPSSMIIFGTGLASLAGMIRRKIRK
jgi:hypothetical protein